MMQCIIHKLLRVPHKHSPDYKHVPCASTLTLLLLYLPHARNNISLTAFVRLPIKEDIIDD